MPVCTASDSTPSQGTTDMVIRAYVSRGGHDILDPLQFPAGFASCVLNISVERTISNVSLSLSLYNSLEPSVPSGQAVDVGRKQQSTHPFHFLHSEYHHHHHHCSEWPTTSRPSSTTAPLPLPVCAQPSNKPTERFHNCCCCFGLSGQTNQTATQSNLHTPSAI